MLKSDLYHFILIFWTMFVAIGWWSVCRVQKWNRKLVSANFGSKLSFERIVRPVLLLLKLERYCCALEAAIGDKIGFLLTFNEAFLQPWIANYLYNLFNLWVNLLLVAIVTFDFKVICEYRLSSQCSLRKSVINLITLRFLYYWALT